jgi:hypothetical protein
MSVNKMDQEYCLKAAPGKSAVSQLSGPDNLTRGKTCLLISYGKFLTSCIDLYVLTSQDLAAPHSINQSQWKRPALLPQVSVSIITIHIPMRYDV